MSDGRLSVEGLGPLRAYVDGEEIDVGPPMRRAAFAVLALCAGAPVAVGPGKRRAGKGRRGSRGPGKRRPGSRG
ncbi:hypothetical protein [Micromonospora sp. KLBMP9576]|uniref:hypothetical protein n=1 Tax=Micromonospora sp. KLBMP9576 TaxID=3424769 RepID=UPI003D9224DA